MNGHCRLRAAAGMLLFIGTAGAATIYNNFGPSHAYNPGSGWPISGAPISEGMAFTPSGTYTLTQIDVAISLSSLPAYATCCTVETVTPPGSIVLSSGTQYWLVASTIASDTMDVWNISSPSVFGLVWQTGFASFSGTVGAFDVLGTVVPEPSAVLLSAGGLALLWLRRLRR
jgi:hypothetical protein